jgi:hypothetical protein
VKHSEALDQIIPALVKAQSAVAVVPKSASNPHWKSLYQPFDAIMAAIKPHLAPNGLALTFGVDNGGTGGADITATLWHVSGQWLSESMWLPFAKLDPQGGCALLTYGSRRLGAALFTIVADDDDDGNTASGITAHADHAAPAPTSRVRAMVEATDLPTERLPGPSSQTPKKERGPVPPCPQCGGEMRDNRLGKVEGSKAPDFKCMEKLGECKDKSGQWPFGVWEGRATTAKPKAVKVPDNTDPHTFDDFPDALASDELPF